MCARVHECIYACTENDLDVLTHRDVGLALVSAQCVLLLQSNDGKKRTGAYPFESLSCTDGGPENQPGGSLSSLCNPRRESANKLGSRESAP